jgi:hypothetical protein
MTAPGREYDLWLAEQLKQAAGDIAVCRNHLDLYTRGDCVGDFGAFRHRTAFSCLKAAIDLTQDTAGDADAQHHHCLDAMALLIYLLPYQRTLRVDLNTIRELLVRTDPNDLFSRTEILRLLSAILSDPGLWKEVKEDAETALRAVCAAMHVSVPAVLTRKAATESLGRARAAWVRQVTRWPPPGPRPHGPKPVSKKRRA